MNRSSAIARLTRPLIIALLLARATFVDGFAASPVVAERIPVLAWGGPPADQTTLERYRELAEAGFTHNFSGFPNLETMATALDVAGLAGIKQFVSIPELVGEPEKVVQRLKDHPALGGYYLRDEPAAADFPALAQSVKRIQALDPAHPCYINLFPNYANATQLGTGSYQEHLSRFVAEVPVSFLSFDHYPVIGETLRDEWYENLEQVAKAARAAQKPFWAFALSVAHGPYPIATLEQLRLQVFSDLAYGAQGIQYFTYWTSRSTDWNFHEGPIDADGRRTPVYDRVKRVNEEIRALSNVFFGARVLRVAHTGPLPKGTHGYEPESPVTNIKTEGNGAVISLLEKGDRKFLVMVNRDFHTAMPVVVEFDSTAGVSETRKDASTHRLTEGRYSTRVDPGDLAILTWER